MCQISHSRVALLWLMQQTSRNIQLPCKTNIIKHSSPNASITAAVLFIKSITISSIDIDILWYWYAFNLSDCYSIFLFHSCTVFVSLMSHLHIHRPTVNHTVWPGHFFCLSSCRCLSYVSLATVSFTGLSNYPVIFLFHQIMCAEQFSPDVSDAGQQL